MADRPPFDLVRASFMLVAVVIGTHCVIVLGGVVFCWINVELVASGRCGDLRGQLLETLAAALAAALAFAGGHIRRDKE